MQIHREQIYEDLFDSYFLQLQIVYKFVATTKYNLSEDDALIYSEQEATKKISELDAFVDTLNDHKIHSKRQSMPSHPHYQVLSSCGRYRVFFTEDAKNQKLRIFGFKDNKWPK